MAVLTNEVVWIEEVVVPHLEGESRRNWNFRLAQTVNMFLLSHHQHPLSSQVLEWEDKPPVEVSLSVHGSVVHICLLCLVLTL